MKRPGRRRVSMIGACHRCGVRFGATAVDAADTLATLRVHQRICPGGSRLQDVVIPLGPVREIRVVRGLA
jgi:hypothetical protein